MKNIFRPLWEHWTLPDYYRNFLVSQKCIHLYESNRWIWRDQQDFPQGCKLTLMFREVQDKEAYVIKSMEYAAKGDSFRSIALSIGDEDSLYIHDENEHRGYFGLCKFACDILAKKNFIHPFEGYTLQLALMALCSHHKRKSMYLISNYLIPAKTISVHRFWEFKDHDELTKLARKKKLVFLSGEKRCYTCLKTRECQQFYLVKEENVAIGRLKLVGKVREKHCDCANGKIQMNEMLLGYWEYDSKTKHLIKKSLKKFLFHYNS